MCATIAKKQPGIWTHDHWSSASVSRDILAEGWEEMGRGIEIFHVTLGVQVEFL